MSTTRKWRSLAAAAADAMFALMAGPAGAEPGDPPQLPFRGSVTGVDSPMAPPDGCFDGAMWRYHSEGPGTFGRLGTVWFEIDHCSAMTSPTAGYFADGTISITAANGDQIFMDEWGTFELDDILPLSYVDLHWEITGGTGRFSGAEGEGTAAPISDLVAGTTTADFTGWITYDASDVAIK